MKNGKRLTYQQKQILNRNGLDANEWFYVKRIDATHFMVINKITTRTMIVNTECGKDEI